VRYAKYLADEELSDVKHEYCNGAVVAMAGGTIAHSRLKTNLLYRLAAALDGKPCAAFAADARVRVTATSLATYPDVSVVCGPVQTDDEDPNAIVNPTALFEVLSPSTAGYDRGEKFDHFMQIPTLRAYVIVDHARPHIDLYTRNPDDTWTRRGFGAGDTVRIDAIDVDVQVKQVYEGWEALRGVEGRG